MVSAHQNFMEAERSARRMAAECAEEAGNETGDRKLHLLAEAKRHDDRANDYKMRAGLYAPKKG